MVTGCKKFIFIILIFGCCSDTAFARRRKSEPQQPSQSEQVQSNDSWKFRLLNIKNWLLRKWNIYGPYFLRRARMDASQDTSKNNSSFSKKRNLAQQQGNDNSGTGDKILFLDSQDLTELSGLENLPDELSVEILEQLSFRNLRRLSQTNKQFHEKIDHDAELNLKALAQERGIDLPNDKNEWYKSFYECARFITPEEIQTIPRLDDATDNNTDFASLVLTELDQDSFAVAISSGEIFVWKKNPDISSATEKPYIFDYKITAKQANPMSLIQLSNKKIVVGYQSGDIKIFNSLNYVGSLKHGESSIDKIIKLRNKNLPSDSFLSADAEGVVKIWTAENNNNGEYELFDTLSVSIIARLNNPDLKSAALEGKHSFYLPVELQNKDLVFFANGHNKNIHMLRWSDNEKKYKKVSEFNVEGLAFSRPWILSKKNRLVVTSVYGIYLSMISENSKEIQFISKKIMELAGHKLMADLFCNEDIFVSVYNPERLVDGSRDKIGFIKISELQNPIFVDHPFHAFDSIQSLSVLSQNNLGSLHRFSGSIQILKVTEYPQLLTPDQVWLVIQLEMAYQSSGDGQYKKHLSYSQEKIFDSLCDYFKKRFANNYKETSGNTSLHKAARDGKIEALVEEVKNKKENLFVENNQGVTPLHLAVLEKKPAAVAFLLEEMKSRNPDKLKEVFAVKDKNGFTISDYALDSDNQNDIIIQLLNDHGAAVAKKPSDTDIKSMSMNDNNQIKRLEADEDLLEKFSEDPHLLHVAARDGDVRQVDNLLASNFNEIDPVAKFIFKNKEGQTPLHLAVLNNKKAVVRKILERAKKQFITTQDREKLLEAKDNQGKTPRDYVQNNQNLTKMFEQFIAGEAPENNLSNENFDLSNFDENPKEHSTMDEID